MCEMYVLVLPLSRMCSLLRAVIRPLEFGISSTSAIIPGEGCASGAWGGW